MQWEYKRMSRGRSLDKNDNATEWNVDLGIERLGLEGWELVAVVPRSDFAGWNVNSDRAGFTSSELWVFKRPLPAT